MTEPILQPTSDISSSWGPAPGLKTINPISYYLQLFSSPCVLWVQLFCWLEGTSIFSRATTREQLWRQYSASLKASADISIRWEEVLPLTPSVTCWPCCLSAERFKKRSCLTIYAAVLFLWRCSVIIEYAAIMWHASVWDWLFWAFVSWHSESIQQYFD